MGRDPADEDPAKPLRRQGVLVSKPQVSVRGSWADPAACPDTLSLAHGPLAVRDNLDLAPENLKGRQDGEELGAVNGLDGPRDGPSRRARLGVPRPEGAGRPPQVRVLGAHSRSIGVNQISPRGPPLPGLTAIHLTRGHRGAIVWVWRGDWMASFRPSGPLSASHLGHTHHLWIGVSLASRHTGQHGSTS